MLSCCNDLITLIISDKDFSSHEDFNELNPSKLVRTLATQDSKFKSIASVGRLQHEA